MRQIVALLLFIGCVSPPLFHFAAADEKATTLGSVRPQPGSPGPLSPGQLEKQLEGPMDAEAIVAVSTWASSVGVVDWLGPLAPVALSPFFGVTCLSGLALWGPGWTTNNAVLGAAGPLRNEWLFFVFLGLTLLTSLPRFTKVSKPFAQAVDRLETYAVIVILLVIKLVISQQSPADLSPGAEQVAVVHLGIVSFTLDTLLAIAMVINVLVINSVKFFLEFLVWLTPVPFLDAVFEVCNKTLCASLMAVYAFSPTVATVINLALLLCAALVLRWISRRVRFYRTMVLDPILASLWTGFGKPKRPELIVFPKEDFGPFKAKSRLRLAPLSSGSGWKFSEANWLWPTKEHTIGTEASPKVQRGWVMHSVVIEEATGTQAVLSFSRRYDDASLAQLLRDLGVDEDSAKEVIQQNRFIDFA